MEIKGRIALLDLLLQLNEQACFPECNVAELVDFLANLPEAEREAILEYIQQGDRPNLLKRFIKIAKMEKDEQNKILKAVGIQQAGGKQNFMAEIFGSTKQGASRAKEVVSDIANVRKTFQEDFLDPIAKLFGLGKK